MSVRPVLEEGSRFSLKKALIGEDGVLAASSPISAAPSVQQQQQQQLQQQRPPNMAPSLRTLTFTPASTAINAAAGPRQTLSFKFDIAAPPMGSVAAVASVPSPPPPPPALAPKAKGLTFSSFSGSGGSATKPSTSYASSTSMAKSLADSKNDVLRLSAIVDSMNAKLSALTEKLQNTEMSLNKANSAFVAERSRARDLKTKLTADTSAAAVEIAKLREQVSNKMTLPTTSNDAAFKTLAKVKEQLEMKHDEIDRLQASMASVSHERDNAAAEIESITSERQAMTEAMTAAIRERDEAVKLLEAATAATAVAAATAAASATEAASEDAALASSLLQAREEAATAVTQLEECKSMHESERCNFEARLSEATAECQSLREQLVLGSPAADLTTTLQPETMSTPVPTTDDDPFFDVQTPTGCGEYHAFETRLDGEYRSDVSDDDDDNDPTTGTVMRSSVFVEKKTSVGYNDRYLPTLLVSASLRCPKSGRIATLHSETASMLPFSNLYGQSSTEGSVPVADEKVKKLIAAVSADIIKSALGSRSEYLLASGMNSEAVKKELEALRGNEDTDT
jgi:hypothetical protein